MQYLVKAAYVIARRAGHEDVGSYIHTEKGNLAKKWRSDQQLKLEKEVDKNEPRELLELLKV